MSQAQATGIEELLGQKTVEAMDRLRREISVSDEARKEAGALWEATRDKRGEAQERHGILSWALGRPAVAVKALEGAETPPVAYVLGLSLRESHRMEEAASALRRAARSEKNLPARIALLNTRIALGEAEEVLKEARAAIKAGQDTADFHGVLGGCHEALGDYEKAIDAYRAALERDPSHAASLFHLACQCDLRGLDEEAMALYERCCALNPTYASAYMNLGVLHEDHGDYEKASDCFRVVLDADPEHPRATLFHKDVEASKHMYYDEELEKVADDRRHLLALPISEFELSVRARNCLKQMNIETLGDLVGLKEEDLLQLRNFGDTSLREVKKLLAEKGLRLGMEAEALLQYQPPVATPELLQRPIADLHFSVRAQRCMDQIGAVTVNDLVTRTKTELVNTKNFGRVSLKEVMDKLAELGLSLTEG